MKVCVIGGGSTYTPELVDGLLRRREQLDLHHVHLVDPDADRLAVLGPLARRMADRAAAGARSSEAPVEVTGGDDRVAGIAGSAFVVSQIRVGGMAARERDEQLGRTFGLIGQETVGVGGLANAWRTIPVALDIAADVARHAPGAVLLNFTNPAGLVTEALCRHGDVHSIGLCNVPWSMRARIAASLDVEVGAVTFDYVGLNHLSWVRGVFVDRDGVRDDRTAEVLARLGRRVQSAGHGDGEPSWTPESIRLVGAVPNDYLLYFYETDAWLAHQAASPTRASRVREIEAALLARYADPALAEAPPELAARGGAHYSEAAAALMADLATAAGTVHVIDTPNRGAIPGLPDDVVVEVSARIGAAGPEPIAVAPLRPDVDALVRTVKDVELLAVEAAVTGDHDTAIRALVTHPLGPSLAQAPALWARLREANAGMLGRLG
ncbi:MAG: 6-phospho-beta-glucosidase [Actinomycetes bacterium]